MNMHKIFVQYKAAIWVYELLQWNSVPQNLVWLVWGETVHLLLCQKITQTTMLPCFKDQAQGWVWSHSTCLYDIQFGLFQLTEVIKNSHNLRNSKKKNGASDEIGITTTQISTTTTMT